VLPPLAARKGRSNMLKRFLVISYYRSKKTGNMCNSISEISEGTSKTGDPYALANGNPQILDNSNHPVGTILAATINLAAEKPAKS
jgi:hypothetical protein